MNEKRNRNNLLVNPPLPACHVLLPLEVTDQSSHDCQRVGLQLVAVVSNQIHKSDKIINSLSNLISGNELLIKTQLY